MSRVAWKGPAGDLVPLVGYLGGTTQVTAPHGPPPATGYLAEVLDDDPLVVWPLDVDGRDVNRREHRDHPHRVERGLV